MLTWVAGTLVDFSVALRVSVPWWAEALEGVLSIDTCSTMVAGVHRETFIDLPFALDTSVSGFTMAGELIDSIIAGTMFARVGGTFVRVVFAIITGGTDRAGTGVSRRHISTCSVMMTGVRCTFVDGFLTQLASVTSIAYTSVTIDTISAVSVMAGIRVAIVDVDFTILALIAWNTFAFVIVDEIDTAEMVLARCRCTIVDVTLAIYSGETFGADTSVRVDFIHTCPTVEARCRIAFVDFVVA